MAEEKQKQLVFLVSQPRAGSTMLQKMIGANSEVYTVSEPWVMLHPLSILRPELHASCYDTKLFQIGFEEFLKNLPDGKASYLKQIGDAYRDIYFSVLEKEERRVFLDKTPRYYYVIEELLEYFPDAKIILLIRNPAAVLASMLESWIGSELHKLADFKGDLLEAPDYLISGLQLKSERILRVQYEELLKSPQEHYSDICNFIGVPFEEQAVNFGSKQEFWKKWIFGDQEDGFKKSYPDEENIDRWLESLNHPVFGRMIKEYVEWLGTDRLGKLGYSDADLEEIKGIDIQKKRMDRSFLFYLDDGRDALVEVSRLKQVRKQQDEALAHKNLALVEGERATKEWRTRSEELDRTVSALKANLEVLKAELDQATGRCGDIDKHLKESRQEVARLARELEEKSVENEQLKNSVKRKLGRASLSPFSWFNKGK